MTTETDKKLITEIKKIMALKLNDFVVDSLVRVNCKRIGIDPENLNQENLSDFSEKIKVSMLLFLTKEEIAEIIREIEKIKI